MCGHNLIMNELTKLLRRIPYDRDKALRAVYE